MNELADQVMRELQLPYLKIETIAHKDTISSDVFRVKISEGVSYVLKMSCDPDRWRREIFFLRKVRPHIPVPEIMHTIAPREDFAGAILMEEVEGHLLSHLPLTEKHAYQMGEMLARLHSIPIDSYGDISIPEKNCTPRGEIQSDFMRSLEECKAILDADVLERIAEYMTENLSLFDEVDGPCIAHRDYRVGNIIGDEDSIRAVIDFEIGRGHFAEADFVSPLHEDFTKKPFFLEGYASIRPLPQHLDRVIPYLSRLRALGGVGFTARRNTWQTKHQYIYLQCISKLKQFFN